MFVSAPFFRANISVSSYQSFCAHLPSYQLLEGRMCSWCIFVSYSGLAQLLTYEQNEWMAGWVNGWMDGWVGGWKDGWVDGWMKPFRIHIILRKIYIQGLIHTLSICEVSRPGTSRGDLDRQSSCSLGILVW